MSIEELLQALHNAGFTDQATADHVRLVVQGQTQANRAAALTRLLNDLGVLGVTK